KQYLCSLFYIKVYTLLTGQYMAIVGPSAYFYGWEVIQYVFYLLDAYVKQFPWQVRISFTIIGLCILTMLQVLILFLNRIIRRKRDQRRYDYYQKRFESAFRTVLSEPEKISYEEIEYICKTDRSEFARLDGRTLTHLIMSLRRELGASIYIPNMQRLCNVTGVRAHLENRLVKGRNVEHVLQTLITLPIRVSEGALAAYTGNKNKQIRELARSYFGFCSKTEPFLLVAQDVNEPFNLLYPITFHRLCGWHLAKGHPTPHFLSLEEHSDNDGKKALFISEVPYYGTEEEKRSLSRFLTTDNPQSCIAAIRAIALIGDPESENDLIKNYDILFPPAKREILQAVARINTGRQTEFLRQAYLHSTSHNTRAVALSCLYNYGEQGRAAFYELSRTGLDDNQFFEQIIFLKNHSQESEA
ncbi:MAG: hypothetical protein IJ680_03515, partial [Paludibacteraceae bacterium]|nr:hypothetical protein [Paludibacteraceae bacterium]